MGINGPSGIQPNVRISGETPTTPLAEPAANKSGAVTPGMATPQMQRAVASGTTSQLIIPAGISKEATPAESDFHAALAPLAKLLNNPALKLGMGTVGAAGFLAGIPTLGAIASAAYALWHFMRFVAQLMARGKLKWAELVKAGGHTAAAFASAAGVPLASTAAFLMDAAEEDLTEDGQPRRKYEPEAAPVPVPMA